MFRKSFIILIMIYMALAVIFLLPCVSFSQGIEQERITYAISPVGTSEYINYGTVTIHGQKLNKVVFRTDVTGFQDTETIYSDPVTFLPFRVDRDISMWLHKEKLVERYFPKENRAQIFKFENGKKVAEYNFKAKGPIHNAVLLPFSLRNAKDLKIGWTLTIRLPDEFIVKLIGLEEVEVPAGKFKAFHFTSTPNKFEIWITADILRLPVKIKGMSGIPYSLLMEEYKFNQNK